MSRRFFFHFNKPESLRQKKTLWSVHFKGTCHITEQIVCKVPCESKSNKHQPYAVMRGFASDLTVEPDRVIIA
jgi:hypothetical protein